MKIILTIFTFYFFSITPAYSQIVQPPPGLEKSVVRTRHLGSAWTNIIPGARVSRDLKTNLVANIRGLPAPLGANSQRDAADKVLRSNGELMGISSDLSNIEFREEKDDIQSKAFFWDQVYQGIKIYGAGSVIIQVNTDLSIFSVSSTIEPISNPRPLSFTINTQQAISTAIAILNAGSVPNPGAQAAQRVLIENGMPKGVWLITFQNSVRIPWAIVVDGSTGAALSASRTDSLG